MKITEEIIEENTLVDQQRSRNKEQGMVNPIEVSARFKSEEKKG